MNNNPLFSVLIANYNNGPYLMETIESIRKQTYKNWEIIIVDDCSSDNSRDIYKALSIDNKINIHFNKENKGVGFTKRKLCELANGEIAGFVDADDAIVEDAIKIMIGVHQENDEISLVYSTFFHCDQELNIINKSTYQCKIPIGNTYLDCSLGRVSHFATFKKKYYLLTEGMNPILKLGEDQDLYYKLEEVGKIMFVDIPLYKYRSNNSGLSSTDSSATIAWGIIAKYEACKRRGINPIEYIGSIVKSEQNLIQFYEKSWDYRLGKWILMPYRFLKYKLFKNSK